MAAIPNERQDAALLDAAARGDVPGVLAALTHGADPNANDGHGFTALIEAARRGHVELVLHLSRSPGLDLDAKCYDFGRTALHHACNRGHTRAAQLLISAPLIDLNATDDQGDTALMLSVARGNAELVTSLAKAERLDPNVMDHDGNSALHLAAEEGDVEIFQAIMAAPGLDVNVKRGGNGPSVLEWALQNKETFIVELLREAGATEPAPDPVFEPAEPDPAVPDDLDVLDVLEELLFEDSATTVHEQDFADGKRSASPPPPTLKRAASFPAPPIDGQVEDDEGTAPVSDVPETNTTIDDATDDEALPPPPPTATPEASEETITKEDWEAMGLTEPEPLWDPNFNDAASKYLLERAKWADVDGIVAAIADGADPNATDEEDGWTPLMHAAVTGHAHPIMLLIMHPAVDVNRQSKLGRTALMCAAYDGYADVVGVLVQDPRVEVNLQCNLGKTALMYAVEAGESSVANVLCAVRRLDLDLKDKFGETARDKVAVLMPTNPNNAAHFRHMSKMLRRGQELRNPSADEAGNEGDAAGGGGESKAGGSPAEVWKRLFVAAEKGLAKDVRTALSEGADVNRQNVDGLTAIHVAARGGHRRVVGILIGHRGIDLQIKNKAGATPRRWAAVWGKTHVEKILKRAEEKREKRARRSKKTATSRRPPKNPAMAATQSNIK